MSQSVHNFSSINMYTGFFIFTDGLSSLLTVTDRLPIPLIRPILSRELWRIDCRSDNMVGFGDLDLCAFVVTLGVQEFHTTVEFLPSPASVACSILPVFGIIEDLKMSLNCTCGLPRERV